MTVISFWEIAGYLLLGGLATVAFRAVWAYMKNRCWHEWGPWHEGEGEFVSVLLRGQNWVEEIQISRCLKCNQKRIRRLET